LKLNEKIQSSDTPVAERYKALKEYERIQKIFIDLTMNRGYRKGDVRTVVLRRPDGKPLNKLIFEDYLTDIQKQAFNNFILTHPTISKHSEIPLNKGEDIIANVGLLTIDVNPNMSRNEILSVFKEAGFGEKEVDEYLSSPDRDAYIHNLIKNLQLNVMKELGYDVTEHHISTLNEGDVGRNYIVYNPENI